MTGTTTKKIAPAALHALKEALVAVYWYKSDLRAFLAQSISEPDILIQLNWADYKRNVVAALVDFLARNEHVHQRHLLRLMTDVVRIDDFAHLLRLDDGKEKASQARAAVEALKKQTRGHADLLKEGEEIEKRRQQLTTRDCEWMQ